MRNIVQIATSVEENNDVVNIFAVTDEGEVWGGRVSARIYNKPLTSKMWLKLPDIPEDSEWDIDVNAY